MDIEEYNDLQQRMGQELTTFLLESLRVYLSQPLTAIEWTGLLRLVYPRVEELRRRSAEIAREFYDTQRSEHLPDSDRHDSLLSSYKFEWFQEAMRPAQNEMSRSGASEDALSQFAMRATKEVENGGRRTILRSVESDPEAQGWARVATGRETCGFCMMMVSRGAVYLSAEGAGLDADDTSATELWRQGDEEAMDELMTRWHPGCDCKVVPVFDRNNWTGRDAYLRAEQLWKDSTSGYRGKDALNALRRSLNAGEISPQDFATAA